MAVNYVTQKCPSCAGTKLEYIKELKSWKCLYCDTLIERHEQADTLFTIKNVVRQTILDVAYVRLREAQKNLIECEKIDSRYVGTIIAEIAYEMNMIIHGGLSQGEQRNMFSQMKKNYNALNALGDQPTEEELALYEFFDSSEVVGALILVFDSINATARRDVLYNYFDPSEIYSLELNTNLISYALKNEKYDMFDTLIRNTDNIDKQSVIKLILEKYPQNEKKIENAVHILSFSDEFGEDCKPYFEDYMANSSDNADIKFNVAKALCSTQARPSIECLMKNLLTQMSDTSKVSELLDFIMCRKLYDVEIYTIVDFAVNGCDEDVCLCIFRRLKETGQFVELNSKHFNAILARSDCSAQTRKNIVEVGLDFNVTEKVKENFISTYLCETYDTPENRNILLPYFFTLVDSLSTATVEKYIIKCSTDGTQKPDIVKRIFSMKINRSFFNNTLSSYIVNSADPFEVRREIVYIMIEAGLHINVSACIKLLTQTDSKPEECVDILRKLKPGGVSYDDLMNSYIPAVTADTFSPEIFSELMSGVTMISESVFTKYVLELKDYPASKAGYTSKMVQLCYNEPQGIICHVKHNGKNVTCTLIQGYILASPDDENLSEAVYTALSSWRSNVNSEIDVDGSRIKFKKYIASQKLALSSVTRKLCQTARVL